MEEIQTNPGATSAIFPTTTAQGSLVEMGPTEIPEEEEERAQLRALAAKFNMTLMPSSSLLYTLGQEITSRMIQRISDKVYQMSSFSLKCFPMALLESHLPAEARTDEEGSTTWLLDTMDKMMLMCPILSSVSDSSCRGLTRCFRAKSQTGAHALCLAAWHARVRE